MGRILNRGLLLGMSCAAVMVLLLDGCSGMAAKTGSATSSGLYNASSGSNGGGTSSGTSSGSSTPGSGDTGSSGSPAGTTGSSGSSGDTGSGSTASSGGTGSGSSGSGSSGSGGSSSTPNGSSYLYSASDYQLTGALATAGTLTQVNWSPVPLPNDQNTSFNFQNTNFLSSDTAGRHLVFVNSSEGYHGAPSASVIYSYLLDPNSGQPTAISGSSLQINYTSERGVLSPNGRFLYLVNEFVNGTATSGLDVYTVDAQTGAVAHLANTPYIGNTALYSWLAINSSGTLLFEIGAGGEVAVWNLDPNTGTAMPVTGSPFVFRYGFGGGSASRAVLSSDGRFLFVLSQGSDPNSSELLTLGLHSDGSLSEVARTEVAGSDGSSLAIDPKQRFAYVWGSTQNTIEVLALDTSGNATVVSDSTVSCHEPSLVIDAQGMYLYATDILGTQSFAIDQSTGRLRQISTSTAVQGNFSALITH